MTQKKRKPVVLSLVCSHKIGIATIPGKGKYVVVDGATKIWLYIFHTPAMYHVMIGNRKSRMSVALADSYSLIHSPEWIVLNALISN